MTCLLVAIAPLTGLALDPERRLSDYAHDVWSMSDGLPHEGIAALQQTRDGYLWVATLDGLVRFDGTKFEVFNLIHLAGLQTNVVVALAEDQDGVLWVGTREGLVRYEKGHFTRVTTAEGARGDFVRCLLADQEGALWIGTRWRGLLRLTQGRIASFTHNDGLLHDDVRSLASDGRGGVWVGTAGGLNLVRADVVARVRLEGESDAPLVSALHVDRRGSLWVGTNAVLWEIPGAAGTRDVATPLRATRRHAGTEVRAFFEDAHGSVWVGLGDGVGRIRGDGVEVATGPERLSHHHVRALTGDHEGSLWIGTDGGGLNRWRDASITLAPYPELAMSLLAVLRAADGAMWVGGNCGGAARWSGGTVTRVTMANGLPNDCVQSLASGPSGDVWIGTFGGVARWTGGRVEAVHTAAGGLPSNQVTSLAVARDGSVWIGTASAGIVRLTGGRFTAFDTSNGLPHPDVRAILEGRDGSIWVGTLGGGLARFNDGAWTRFSRSEGLSNDHVLSLREDADGTLWVGTIGGGLNRVRDGRVAHYTSANGLPGDSVFRILDDGRGVLWMSSHRGIFGVSRQQLDDVASGRAARVFPHAFGVSDGLPAGGALGGTQPAGDIDTQGRLWFPTLRGPVVIDPGRLVRNQVAPRVHVERVRVEGHEAAAEMLASLGPGARDIEIDYTALSYLAPSAVRFKYRLEGFDDEWVDAGGRRTAYFTNLRPGAYRFRVVASNNDGVWNEEGATVAFVLRPHAYQTAWFLAVCVVAASGLAWAGLRLRERRLRARQEHLARQVEQAMAEVKVLSGLLPICASCKRIRDEGDRWQPMESYIQQHSHADFTHGICPECMQKLYPE